VVPVLPMLTRNPESGLPRCPDERMSGLAGEHCTVQALGKPEYRLKPLVVQVLPMLTRNPEYRAVRISGRALYLRKPGLSMNIHNNLRDHITFIKRSNLVYTT